MKHITPTERIGMAEARQLRMESRLIRQDAEIKALRASMNEMQSAMRDAMSRLVAAAEAPVRGAVVGAVEAVPRARMAEIAAAVAIATDLTVAEIRGPRRDKAAAHPRQQAMLMMHQAGYSLPMIGRFFKRDHTTVLHGVRAAKSRLEGEKPCGDNVISGSLSGPEGCLQRPTGPDQHGTVGGSANVG